MVGPEGGTTHERCSPSTAIVTIRSDKTMWSGWSPQPMIVMGKVRCPLRLRGEIEAWANGDGPTNPERRPQRSH
jgi:hypothetical protein